MSVRPVPRRRPLHPLAGYALAAALLASPTWGDSADQGASRDSQEEWSQYRGPRGDGRAAGSAEPWRQGPPRELWRRPLGGGFSGLSLVDDTLYTLASSRDEEFLMAIRASDGEERWRLRTDTKRRDQFGDGPRSTPTVDGDLVYAVSALGKLWAVERGSGKARWSRDLRKQDGAAVPTWGVSATPVVVDDSLLLNVGGRPGHALMAFDKKTGEVKWKAESGIPGYSLPLTFTALDQRQTVFFTGRRLIAVDPENGRILWDRPWRTAYDVNAAAPIFLPPNRLFISSGYDTGASLFELSEKGEGMELSEVWRSRKMKNQFSSSVHAAGHLYGFDNKNLRCLDAETGQVKWTAKGFGHGSLLWVDDHLVVLGDQGKLALVEATPQSYQEIWTLRVAKGKHWTVPTLSGDRLFIRNEKELVAFGPASPTGADAR